MSERELKLKIIEHADKIAEVLANKKDCELRTSPNGITVISNKKEVIVK